MIRQLLFAALVGLALSAPSSRIEDSLRLKLKNEGKANIFILFKEDTDQVLARIDNMRFATRGSKIFEMKHQLEQLAKESQRGVLNILQARPRKFESFWISNRVFVPEADAGLVDLIAADENVALVREEEIYDVPQPIYEVDNSTIQAEWGINKIEAEAAWSLPGGNNGQGVVVSNIDTGVRYTHNALRNNYRSSYGWYDPYQRTTNPNDQNGHGTHTMGTIAGSNGVGVAPGSSWIACKGCSTSSCSESALQACGQWTTCPTLASGGSPNCNMAPDLSSNSWGGGQGSTSYQSVVNAWQSAGITPVFAIGNSGPACGTANSPGDLTNVIAVGSTDSSDTVSSFSSRGPAVRGGVKPDVSAPGSSVRSTWYTSDTAYNTISGTSMATPHVAGTVALLKSRNSGLTYTQIKNYLQNNADRSLGSAATCGGTPPSAVPNNIYGYGRINARRALSAAIG